MALDSSSVSSRLGPLGLNFYAKLTSPVNPHWKSFNWRNLHFRNPLGIAGGVDKNARQILAWQHFGAGFIEIGTVTPEAQKANPGTVILRDPHSRTLWNKLGFPNEGAIAIKNRIQKLPRPYQTPLFINIGKNRITPIEHAHVDYARLLREFEDVADAFVINISSPNTEGLRDLLKKENIHTFLSKVSKVQNKVPLILKISPDVDFAQLETLISASLENQIAGWVLTNTTLGRWPNSPYPREGGVSGEFLREHSREFLRSFIKLLGSRKADKLVVSVGGVMSAEEVKVRLDLGADLVQVYTCLLYTSDAADE